MEGNPGPTNPSVMELRSPSRHSARPFFHINDWVGSFALDHSPGKLKELGRIGKALARLELPNHALQRPRRDNPVPLQPFRRTVTADPADGSVGNC